MRKQCNNLSQRVRLSGAALEGEDKLHPRDANTSDLIHEMAFEVSDAASLEEWQEVADRCRYATFFHSPSWYVAFSKTYPKYKIATKQFVFADGMSALFPLLEHSMIAGWHKNYLIGPAGCYGGWISADNLGAKHVAAITGWVFRNLQNFTWRANPFDETASLLDTYATIADTTEVLILDQFDNAEQLRIAYKSRGRKEIKKAHKLDLAIGKAQCWPEWEEYFGLYRKALLRWGDKASSRYPIELFRNFFELNKNTVTLWLIWHENKIIGGNLNFYQSKHCVEWHAAFDSEFFGAGTRNFLVDHVITHALQRGYHYYDFNPSGGHEGARKFKQAFGTTQMPANIIAPNNVSRTVDLILKLKRFAG